MLTKTQKTEVIEKGAEEIKQSKSVLFADFSGASIDDLQKLRRVLREFGAKFLVIKKRLLKLAFKKMGVDYDPTQFNNQAGAIFISDEVVSVAGPISKLDFIKVLGGVDLEENKDISLEEFNILSKLPSREILLAQIAIAFSMPIKQLAYALNQIVENKNE